MLTRILWSIVPIIVSRVLKKRSESKKNQDHKTRHQGKE